MLNSKAGWLEGKRRRKRRLPSRHTWQGHHCTLCRNLLAGCDQQQWGRASVGWSGSFCARQWKQRRDRAPADRGRCAWRPWMWRSCGAGLGAPPPWPTWQSHPSLGFSQCLQLGRPGSRPPCCAARFAWPHLLGGLVLFATLPASLLWWSTTARWSPRSFAVFLSPSTGFGCLRRVLRLPGWCGHGRGCKPTRHGP